ncbi:hypothetical protein ABZP36_023494 [Zizania latifolia]
MGRRRAAVRKQQPSRRRMRHVTPPCAGRRAAARRRWPSPPCSHAQDGKKKVLEQQWRILYLESQVQPKRKTWVTVHKSVPLPCEQQRIVLEVCEGTGKCVAIAPAPVLAPAPSWDQPMGDDSGEPMEEEFFEESGTKEPLLDNTPAP